MLVHQLEQRRVVVEIDASLIATGMKGAQLERGATLRPAPEQALANAFLDDLADGLPPCGGDLPDLVQQVLVDGDRGAHSIRAYHRCIMMHPGPPVAGAEKQRLAGVDTTCRHTSRGDVLGVRARLTGAVCSQRWVRVATR